MRVIGNEAVRHVGLDHGMAPRFDRESHIRIHLGPHVVELSSGFRQRLQHIQLREFSTQLLEARRHLLNLAP